MKNKYGTTADGQPLNSQWETVLYFLQSTGKPITQWEAIKEFGFTRLSAIVKQIEYRRGIILHRRRKSVTTRYGGQTHVTEYWYENTGNRANR